ncbi:MAG: PD40 domain-containing protein [Deltaproteobacteria bacterium]|nr:PD40 domain-containing protein [Deltaproteobacteria bacterium]
MDRILALFAPVGLLLSGCPRHPCESAVPSRAEILPGDIPKGTAETDFFRPVMLSQDFDAPLPLAEPVTTSGAEDSPFFTPDGEHLFFFFAPDARVPANEQLQDCTVGIWHASIGADGSFAEPERLLLGTDLALDGCPTVANDELSFCSARAGNHHEIDVYAAPFVDGQVGAVSNVEELNGEQTIGEWHFSPDGTTMWFGAALADSRGGMDLYEMHQEGEAWGEPVNLGEVNGQGDEGFPWVSADGDEMYFHRNSASGGTGPAIWRSRRGADGGFGAAEEIAYNFAGEPNLNANGDLVFVHHYMSDPAVGPIEIREADLMIARRR